MFAQVKRLFVTAVVVSAFSIIIFVIVPAILNFDGVQRFNGFEFLADQLSTLASGGRKASESNMGTHSK